MSKGHFKLHRSAFDPMPFHMAFFKNYKADNEKAILPSLMSRTANSIHGNLMIIAWMTDFAKIRLQAWVLEDTSHAPSKLQ